MWRRVLDLFFRQPELILNHIEAYATQASQELREVKLRYFKAMAGLAVSSFALALSFILLAFAGMLDLALSIDNRGLVYGVPAGMILLFAICFFYFKSTLKAGSNSTIKEQLRADFQMIKGVASQA